MSLINLIGFATKGTSYSTSPPNLPDWYLPDQYRRIHRKPRPNLHRPLQRGFLAWMHKTGMWRSDR